MLLRTWVMRAETPETLCIERGVVLSVQISHLVDRAFLHMVISCPVTELVPTLPSRPEYRVDPSIGT